MPIYLDMRDDQGRKGKDKLNIIGDLQSSELIAHEQKLAEDRMRRIELLKQKYPHLKNLEVV